MINDLRKLKSELDALLIERSLNSPEALNLSREIDNHILEYYRKQFSSQKNPDIIKIMQRK